jgi:hypothetical protein
LEAEYLSFDKALLTSDDVRGHCHATKFFKRGILAGLSHAPRRAPCCDHTSMWRHAVAGAERDGDFRVRDDTAKRPPTSEEEPQDAG